MMLKNCPGCGSCATVETRVTKHHLPKTTTRSDLWRILCFNCNMRTAWSDSQEFITSEWNRRADDWRPIATLHHPDGTLVQGWGEYRERDGFSPAFMRWSDLAKGWSVNAMPFYPTHWKPMPGAPS